MVYCIAFLMCIHVFEMYFLRKQLFDFMVADCCVFLWIVLLSNYWEMFKKEYSGSYKSARLLNLNPNSYKSHFLTEKDS